MKIAFVGKGGSGKTTLTSLFARHLAASGSPVLAFDADINQHLGAALGLSDEDGAGIPTLGGNLPLIKEYLRGHNPRIPDADDMVKTTPPGSGSRLLTVVEDNPVYERCVRDVDGVRFAATGPFTDGDLGVACYHSKVGAAEMLLNHLVDDRGEYVLVDMTAGADGFASGLFTRFDVTFLVCEPTVRSLGVYRQYLGHANDFDVRIAAVGNKITDAEDRDFLRSHLDDELLTCFNSSRHVRAGERGELRPIGELEADNTAALTEMRGLVDNVEKDWAKFQRQAVEVHLRNASARGDDNGHDLVDQVDPDFQHGPGALHPVTAI